MKLSPVHWLIAAALAANGAVFYWQQTRSATVTRTEPGGLRELKLLGELEQDGLAAAVSQPAAPVETTALVEQPAPEPAYGDAEPEQSLADSVEAATGSSTIEPGESLPAAATAAGTELEAEEAPVPEAVATAAPSRCWLAGPVNDELISEQLTVAFAAAGVSMDLVLQTTEVATNHWVHLPTSGEQADVRRLSRELREGGTENFPINSGQLAGSLSVGLFRSERRAIALRDELRSRGYSQVEIYRSPALAEQPWITLDDGGRVALDWPAQEGELPGYQDLRLLTVDCDPQS